MANQPRLPPPRRLRLAELVLLVLPALLLIVLALHLRNQEIARHNVKRAIEGKGQGDSLSDVMICSVENNHLFIRNINYNVQRVPFYKFIDDNHFCDQDYPSGAVEVTINGDKMVWRDNQRPPHITNYRRIKSMSNK